MAPPSNRETILDAVSSYRNEIVDFTKALVAVLTENPPGSAYLECAGLIEGELNKVGLDCSVIEAPSALKSNREYSGENERIPRCSILSYYGIGKRTLSISFGQVYAHSSLFERLDFVATPVATYPPF